MIPTEFDYHRPASVDEALELLSRYGEDAKLFAGGHSLLPAMKLRLSSPAVLIDISRLEDLKGIGDWMFYINSNYFSIILSVHF